MIQKAKVYLLEIPFYELFNYKFNTGISFKVLNKNSLFFERDENGEFTDYNNFINDPANKLIFDQEAKLLKFGDSDTVRITSFSRTDDSLNVGFVPSKYSVYKGFNRLIGYSKEDEGFLDGVVGNRLLANHCGTGVFIDCRRGGTGRDSEDRVLIGMRPNSNVIDTHRLFRTYSASGSSDLNDGSPFETIRREAEEEINFSLDVDKTELISFGYDSQLGYFQFSFYHKSEMDFSEIVAQAKFARDAFEYDSLDLITYSEKKLGRAVDEVAKIPWEPSALFTIILLFSRLISNDSRDIREYEARFTNFRRDLENEIIKNNNEKNFKIFV
ncbi:MAG: NUDIX hydrolase [Bacteroidales bacterium]|jgi:8-oxo-dGTP pyrophosphatase MutT (NUDIX family)|nr:NUDIX hydrolase [Bacteroidales bacterium]